ncbi:MAG: type VI secretion system tip protein VgrG [Phycisphaeraceae bacterium]|nr:type VI secretion system tip protein VgrG [Phycisphaeraceae bacterium]
MSESQGERWVQVSTESSETFVLRRFRGQERLGRLFEYTLDVLSQNPKVKFEDLLGTNVSVSVSRQDAQGEPVDPRFFNGMVREMAHVGWVGRWMCYRLTLVPTLWFASLGEMCRVHKPRDDAKVKIPDLLEELIQPYGDVRNALQSKDYREWEFVVQYNESDFDHFSRRMEHEGIYYFFEHENGKHTMVLADDPGSHETFPDAAEVELLPPSVGETSGRYIRDWRMVKTLVNAVYMTRDFDYTSPQTPIELVNASGTPGKPPPLGGIVYEWPGGYDTPAEGSVYAAARAEEECADYEVCSGETDNPGIACGYRFKLKVPEGLDIEFAESQEREYLVVSAEYDFSNPELESETADPDAPVYVCEFTAIDAKVSYRTPRETPVPEAGGPQTAFVTGKSGEEIDSDALGRVKIQFHWDLDGQYDEKTSIWVRVAQVWASKKWGALFTPRIGDEVIVEFIDGDLDFPIVTGRVYNSFNEPPYDQGQFPTLSGIKSNSSKGGGGFNEIRFDDKKDEEQLFVHAQKNYDQRVLNDRFEWIGNNRHLQVGNDKHEIIGNDRHEKVKRDHVELIERDRHRTVKGKEAILVEKAHSETVNDDVIETYKKNQSTVVTKDLYIEADNININGKTNVTINVGDSFVAIESGGIKIGTNGDIVLDAKGNISAEAKGNISSNSTGNTEIKSTGNMDIKSTGLTTVDSTGPGTVKSSAILTVQGSVVKIN